MFLIFEVIKLFKKIRKHEEEIMSAVVILNEKINALATTVTNVEAKINELKVPVPVDEQPILDAAAAVGELTNKLNTAIG